MYEVGTNVVTKGKALHLKSVIGYTLVQNLDGGLSGTLKKKTSLYEVKVGYFGYVIVYFKIG